MQERGQALTLEGSIAAVLLVTSLVFALQVSAVTPLTESTASQHIENQQKEVGRNVLAAAAEDGTLKATVLYWDRDQWDYKESAPKTDGYANGLPSDVADPQVSEFGETLERAFDQRGIAYNIHVNYLEKVERNGDEVLEIESQQLVDQGQPSNHAVTVTRTVTLYEDDELDDGTQLSDSNFYAENIDADTDVYSVVEVELVIWRM